MVAPFKRFFIPAVKLETPQGTLVNLDGQGIRFQWTITRDNTNTPDEGEIIAYNLSPALSGTIFEAWQQISRGSRSGYLITFGIGWEGVPKTVIIGDVWDLVPQRRTPTDVLTIFRIGDGNQVTRDNALGRTFKSIPTGQIVDTIVRLLQGVGGLGLLYPPESKALVEEAAANLPVTAWRNMPAGWNTRDFLDFIMDTLGLEWRIHNGAFIAMRGGIINRPGPILRPSTGLITYEKRNDGGVICNALANPEVEPGIQIQVQDNDGKPFGEPVYRTERVTFAGDSKNESTMVVEAAKGRLL